MRLIDADKLKEAIRDFPYGYRGMIENVIENTPTIEAIPFEDCLICARTHSKRGQMGKDV